ncbi:MAG: efflux RND transporter periplasmic adaptor subunit [Armatimonadota bacterium]
MKHRRWIGVAVAVVVVACTGWSLLRGRGREQPEQAVQTATVTRGDLRVTVAATGVLEPLTTVEVRSRSGGKITNVYVEAGDYVEAGQLIAQLDPTDLQSQVDQASAQVRAADARVVQARYSAEAQREQTRTQVGEAEAALEAARARLRQARSELAQTEKTVEQQIAQAQAGVTSAQARLAQARAREQAQPQHTAAQIAQNEAALERARQALAALEAGSRPEEIAQAQARVAEAQASADNARVELERQQGLAARGFTSQQAVDSAQRTYDTAAAQLESARQALALVRAGTRAEEIAQARAAVTQAEAQLASARAGQVDVEVRAREREAAEAALAEAQAALRSAQAQRLSIDVRRDEVDAAQRAVEQAEASLQRAQSGTLTDAVKRQEIAATIADLQRTQAQLDDQLYSFQNTTIVAPRAGVILEKLVEEGTVVPPGTAALAQGTGIVTIADITSMYVTADVDETDISRIAVDQPVEITVETLLDTIIHGRVDKIFPQGKEEENVVYFPVRIEVIELLPDLRPGMSVDVEIITAERKDVLLVPDNAIQKTEDGKRAVLVMSPDGGRPERRIVEVGVTDYSQTEIISGVREGETIVAPTSKRAGADAEEMPGGPTVGQRATMAVGGPPGPPPR